MPPVMSRPAGGRSSATLGFVGAASVAGTAFVSQRSQTHAPQSSSLRGPQTGQARSTETNNLFDGRLSSTSMADFAVFGATLAIGSAAVLKTSGARNSKQHVATLAMQAAAEAAEAATPPLPPFNPAEQIGAMAPLGFFDPLGFSKVGDEQGWRQLRAAEIKHGRVAMMASIGAVGQHFIRFPGFENVHGTFGAAVSGAGTLGLFVLFAASSMLELDWRDDKDKEPGNFGDPFGVKMYTPEMREKEISNGRMAMLSVLGIWGAELATGKDAIEQFGLPALPVRGGSSSSTASAFAGSSANRFASGRGRALAATAVETEAPPPPPFNPAEQIGAMAPLGFFDPLGFSKVGDEQGWRQLRAAEIKHGRVAMMASIGAVGQHFIRFPGFENVHGTFGAAVSGAGTLGLFVLFAASSMLELAWRDDKDKEPGNFGDPFGVKMYTPEMREKEISNGRMAMLSVLGIWGAELATGKDAIEQFGL